MWQTWRTHVLITNLKKINLKTGFDILFQFMHLKLAILPPPFFLTLDYSVVHKIVAIIPAEFDFNMFIKFHTYILTYTKNPQAFVFLDIKQTFQSSHSLSLFDTKVKFGWRRTREFKNKTFGTQCRGVPIFRQDFGSIWTGKAKKHAYLYEFPILESISTCTHNRTDIKIQIRVVGRWTV